MLVRVSDLTPPLDPQSVALRDSLAGLLRDRVAAQARPAAKRAVSFSLEMAQALRAGRKTETRRLVRPLVAQKPDVASCPNATVGERLWVREPFAETTPGFIYAADGVAPAGVRFRPAMYMPRRASRFNLLVTSVIAERLHAITDDAIRREGCLPDILIHRAWFSHLWNGYHAERGQRWGDNPWVWVIRFEIEK